MTTPSPQQPPAARRLDDPLHLAPHRLALNRIGVSVDSDAGQRSQIADALASLRAAYVKLTDIPDDDIKAMKDADRAAWAGAADELFRDIRKLETAELQALNQQFQARSDDLLKASSALETRVNKLSDVAQIVKAVASGLSIITNIVGLLK